MQKNKLLFVILIFLNFTVKTSSDLSNLEDGILNSDVEKVKEILNSVSLSEHDKVGLIDIANDMILKRLKDVEYWVLKHAVDSKEREKVGTGWPVIVTSLGLLGILVACPAMEVSDEVVQKCATVVTLISLVAFFGGFFWLEVRLQQAADKINQAYPDAIKIKKLIHAKVCIA